MVGRADSELKRLKCFWYKDMYYLRISDTVKTNYEEFEGSKYFIDSWKMSRLVSALLTAQHSVSLLEPRRDRSSQLYDLLLPAEHDGPRLVTTTTALLLSLFVSKLPALV